MTSSDRTGELCSLILAAAAGGALRRLVLSRPFGDAAERITGKLCLFRGERVLALEAPTPTGRSATAASLCRLTARPRRPFAPRMPRSTS